MNDNMMLLEKMARFEEGVSVDVPDYLRDHGNPEAAERWVEEHEKHKDEFKSASEALSHLAFLADESVGPDSSTSTYLTEMTGSGDPASALPGDPREGRYEEGKPADPTKNMSPEDAAKWREEHEKHKNEFKSAASYQYSLETLRGGKVYEETSDRKPTSRDAAVSAKASDTETADVVVYNDQYPKKEISRETYDTDGKKVTDPAVPVNKRKRKTACACDTESELVARYEEGKPADPTENMTQEDAKKWDENTEKYQDKFKTASGTVHLPGLPEMTACGEKIDPRTEMSDSVLDLTCYYCGLAWSRKNGLLPLRVRQQIRSASSWDRVPSLNNWSMSAGGIGGGGKHGYSVRVGTKNYSISPTTYPNGKFRGYVLTVHPAERGLHGWITDDGEENYSGNSMFRDPRRAAGAAILHYEKLNERGITASEDELIARYEEGKPADPTENMSPEDAKEWESNTDKYTDKFTKKAYFTVVIPPGDTEWHDNRKTITRGAFKTEQEAHMWAKRNIPGYDYTVKEFDDPEVIEKAMVEVAQAVYHSENRGVRIQHLPPVGVREMLAEGAVKAERGFLYPKEPAFTRFLRSLRGLRLASEMPTDLDPILADGCPDNLDESGCAEWESNTEKYKDVVKNQHQAGRIQPRPTPSHAAEKEESDDPEETGTQTKSGASKKTAPTQFTYTIDTDERDEFRATVYGPGGKEVLDVNEETLEDGWMKNKNDLTGLAQYLEHLEIGGKGTKVRKDAASGLYGFSKGIQSDCDSCVKKLTRGAEKLARQIYSKDEKVAPFLSKHAQRAESLPAQILTAAMKSLGPKIASAKTANSLQDLAVDIALEIDNDIDMACTLSFYLVEDRDTVMAQRFWEYAKQYEQAKLKRPSQTLLNRIRVYIDQAAEIRAFISFLLGECNADALAGRVSPMLTRLASENPEDQEKPETEPETDPESKTAAASRYGLYGYPSKTASLGLTACAQIREVAGTLASDLHRKKADKYAHITGYLDAHAKQANCLYSRLLHASYPENERAVKAAAMPKTVAEWLDWEK
jgi:hypothetical protein